MTVKKVDLEAHIYHNDRDTIVIKFGEDSRKISLSGNIVMGLNSTNRISSISIADPEYVSLLIQKLKE